MLIITVLTVSTSEVSIQDCLNDPLVAQNSYLDTVEKCSAAEENGTTFESIFVSKTQANIYRKERGWVSNYKVLDKIVVLHNVGEYTICDSDSMDAPTN